jgi:hypothetical protein
MMVPLLLGSLLVMILMVFLTGNSPQQQWQIAVGLGSAMFPLPRMALEINQNTAEDTPIAIGTLHQSSASMAFNCWNSSSSVGIMGTYAHSVV